MFKIAFTTSELETIKKQVVFSDLQEQIIEMKRKEMSNVQIAMNCGISTSTLSRELKKIADKIKKAL